MLLGRRHGLVLAVRELGEGQQDVLHRVVVRSLHAFFFGDRDLGGVILPGAQQLDFLFPREAGMAEDFLRAGRFQCRTGQRPPRRFVVDGVAHLTGPFTMAGRFLPGILAWQPPM